MKGKKVIGSACQVFSDRGAAEFYAKSWRAPGRSVRVFPRTIRAGGAIIEVFAVVVYVVDGPKVVPMPAKEVA